MSESKYVDILLTQNDEGETRTFRVMWNRTEGHVFIAEKTDDTVRFVDPQNGKINCEDYFTKASIGATMMARVDNLEPSELIEECIKNRGGRK